MHITTFGLTKHKLDLNRFSYLKLIQRADEALLVVSKILKFLSFEA